MLMSQTGWLAAVIASCGMIYSTVAWAEAPADKTDAENTAYIVEQVALAAELTAFGRGELADVTGLKDFKSPEALVASGAILLRIHKQTAGKMKVSNSTVTDDEGKPIAADGPVNSFEDEASALFDEARAMPSKDKAALESLIKQAELVPERGAAGGPQVINRTVKSGKTHTINLAFEPNAPANVTMRGSGKVKFEVVGPAGKVLWHSQGSWGYYNWQAGKASDRGITIKVINSGGPPVAYTVTTN